MVPRPQERAAPNYEDAFVMSKIIAGTIAALTIVSALAATTGVSLAAGALITVASTSGGYTVPVQNCSYAERYDLHLPQYCDPYR